MRYQNSYQVSHYFKVITLPQTKERRGANNETALWEGFVCLTLHKLVHKVHTVKVHKVVHTVALFSGEHVLKLKQEQTTNQLSSLLLVDSNTTLYYLQK